MGTLSVKEQALAQKVSEFTRKPENLLLAIVYNNPDYVSQNVQDYAGVSYAMTDEQIMDWFEQYGGELDAEALYNILNVPFNPDAENVTADYWDVIDYQSRQLFGDQNNDQYYTWAELFPEGIQNLYDKYFAGQQATGTIGADIDQDNADKQSERQRLTQKIERTRKGWQLAAVIFRAVVLLSFLVLLIVGIIAVSKSKSASA